MHDQFNMDNKEIAKKIGKSSALVSNYMRLLQLPDFAKKAVAEGRLSEGHARQVLALSGDESAQRELVEHIIKEDWSVRKAEQFVIGYKNGKKSPTTAVRAVKKTNAFTKSLSEKFGLPVQQKVMGRGGGQIIITYKEESELESLKKNLNL